MKPSVEDVERFRRLHNAERLLVLPNAWDFASAAALAAEGFAAVATTSLGVAAAAGKPDGTGTTRDETLAVARSMAGLGCLISVDAEGGFSDDPEEVAEFACQLANVGVVGINLEDGRADGSLWPVDHLCTIVAAVKARVPELFVNARTDTFWLAGQHAPSLPSTLERVAAYAAAGADGVFVPGVTEDDSISAIVGAVAVPLNVLFMPERHTLGRLAELGVRRVSLGSLLYRVGLGAAVAAALAVRDAQPVALTGVPSYATVQALLPQPPTSA